MQTEKLTENLQPNKEVFFTNKIKQLETVTHLVAHNLRGSAANIKMLAETLLSKNISDDCQTESDDDIFTISEAIQYIHDGSTALLNTLNTLMDVTDVQLNKEPRFDECSIADIVEHITNQLNGFIQQKEAIIEHNLAVSHISYPTLYMESILYNFINNALKYSKTDVQLKIIISTYNQEGRTMLSVKDNGIGIDLKVYGRRIFNLYQVFHSGYESKGIGLYIIKQQIESLGGTVSVKSIVNEGSEFIVAFSST